MPSKPPGQDRVISVFISSTLQDTMRERDLLEVFPEIRRKCANHFATYDILPGLYMGLKAGLTIVDLSGNPITSKLDLEDIIATFQSDPAHPKRMAFIAAKEPALAEQVLKLLKTP